ncbi:MAG: HIRAN domain-containing protein [Clostridium sp.]|nr:HIRAN domain-containing protein [Clostridium sp.]
MAKKDGRDYIYLVWKEPKSRKQFRIGILSRNGKYQFKYGFEINDALKEGFSLLIAFDDINKTYENDKLFPTFSSRIPDKRRKDINLILNKYGLKEYDEYQLLKKSGGSLPIDDLLFIDPILDNSETPIERIFFVAGQRHYLGCNGEECIRALNLHENQELLLELEPENKYDKDAIKIITKDKDLIGYIPRYYNKELLCLIEKGAKYTLKVHEFNKDKNCNECLKLQLVVRN